MFFNQDANDLPMLQYYYVTKKRKVAIKILQKNGKHSIFFRCFQRKIFVRCQNVNNGIIPSSPTQSGFSRFEDSLERGYNVSFFLESPCELVIFPSLHPMSAYVMVIQGLTKIRGYPLSLLFALRTMKSVGYS